MEQLLCQVSALVAHKTGLCFPVARNSDLQRALISAAQELGIADVARYADALLSERRSDAHLSALVRHLTVGETYFWRDRRAFDALAAQVLPELVRHRAQQRRLRMWSAACCTGEEAYSLAILVQQCVPDWRDWNISILGTDINEVFLQRAAAGVYGEWSFRDVPAGFKECHFSRDDRGRYAILPRVRQMVRFAAHNLIDPPASSALSAASMDLILCRNVLMYLTPDQSRRVVANLHGSLAEHGWLVVAPSECSQTLFRDFESMSFPGTILYRKQMPARHTAVHEPTATIDALSPARMSLSEATPDAGTSVTNPSQRLRHEAAAEDSRTDGRAATDVAARARALANSGRLQEALVCCQRWLAADALDSHAHYLRAMILQELGQTAEARRAFRQAIYLEPELTLAHVGLGNLARAEGRSEQAIKHFTNALASLRGAAPDEPLEEGDGLTVRRLQGILTSMLAFEPTL